MSTIRDTTDILRFHIWLKGFVDNLNLELTHTLNYHFLPPVYNPSIQIDVKPPPHNTARIMLSVSTDSGLDVPSSDP